MARRLPHVIALAAIVLLSLPTAAFAEYSSRIEAPNNAVVTGPTEIQVRVSRDALDVPVTGLRVRPATGGEWRPTTCKSGCESGDRSSIYAFDLDPRSGAPFGTSIMSNGTFEFEARASRAFGRSDETVGRLALTLRVPGSAVGGLAATVSDQTVRLAWSRAPEPDILRYRVERCAGTCDGAGAWLPQGEAGASASSFTDEPEVGTYSYRVVTVRDGGGEGSIETVSSPVIAEVEAPPVDADSRQDGSSNGNGNGDRSGNGGGNGDGTADSDGSPRSASAPDVDEANGPDGAAPEATPSPRNSRSSGIRSGRAPSVSLERGGVGIPELPGIGDIFRGELDYATGEPRTADGDTRGPGDDDEVLLSSPGGTGSTFIGQLTDPDRVAVPIAGGLLMTAIGLHLWRWLRVPLR